MNFKKTLVALAMAGFASGAMASDVTLDNGIWTLSAEGIQAEEVADMQSAAGEGFDFFLDQEISASGVVSIKFDEGFKFADNAMAASGTIVNGSGAGLIDTNKLKIRYGSASFTFVSYTWDQATQTLALTLGNGQPLLGGASFGLEVGASVADMVNVAAVDVTTNKFDGTQIETFSKTVSQTASQFAVKTLVPMTGMVQVANRDQFVVGATGTSTTTVNEYGEILFIDMKDEYKAPATVFDMDVTLLGDFTNEAAPQGKWTGTFGLSGVAGGVSNTANPTDTEKTEITLTSPVGTSAGKAHIFTYASGNGEALVTPFEVAAELNITGLDNPVSYMSTTGFGSWDLQDGVINVPYLPVGFSGLSANVEISNESAEDATIYVEAFNQNGEYFSRVELAQLAKGQTVTKVSAQDLINAFGLTGQNKLSVTFSFDINGAEGAEGITLAPYYRQNESRINVLSDEYKGK